MTRLFFTRFKRWKGTRSFKDARERRVRGLRSDERVFVYKESFDDFGIGFFNFMAIRNNATPVDITKRSGIGLSPRCNKMQTPRYVFPNKVIELIR